MEYLYGNKIIIILLPCITSCKPNLPQENVYELLIRCTYDKIDNNFVRYNTWVDLIAVEKERDSVLQQHYTTNMMKRIIFLLHTVARQKVRIH